MIFFFFDFLLPARLPNKCSYSGKGVAAMCHQVSQQADHGSIMPLELMRVGAFAAFLRKNRSLTSQNGEEQYVPVTTTA